MPSRMEAETLNLDMKIHSKILGVVATGFVAGLERVAAGDRAGQ